MPNTTDPELLTISETAAWLHVSKRKVWELVATGEIPVVRLGVKTVRIDARDLRALVEERRERRGR